MHSSVADKSSLLLLKRSLIGSLYLCVGAALPLAFATGEEISLSASGGGHLVVPDSLFGQILPHFLQLVTGHFLQSKEERST